MLQVQYRRSLDACLHKNGFAQPEGVILEPPVSAVHAQTHNWHLFGSLFSEKNVDRFNLTEALANYQGQQWMDPK